MIDVEQHALRSFEQDALARLLRFVQRAPHRLGKGQDKGCNLAQVGQQALPIDRFLTEPDAKGIVVRADPVQLRTKIVKVCQIADPDRAAANLVLIGRTDSAPRGADLARAAGIFAQGIKIAVERQDQRGIFGDLQVLRVHIDPLPLQLGHFIAEVPGIKHDAVADDRKRAGDNARGKQRQLVNLIAHDQRMTGIVATLKAHHGIGAAGQPVDNLALALIAPLSADYRYIGHGYSPTPARLSASALRQDSAQGMD